MNLSKEYKSDPSLKVNGKVYRKGNDIFVETIYGSFVNLYDDGMSREKNAISEKRLVKYGYLRVDKD